MTDKETEELNRWCHEFLGNEWCICPTECDCENYEKGLVSNECPEHNIEPYFRENCPAHDEHYIPDYTTDRNEAAKVEAKAIETVGLSAYLDAVDAGLSSNDPTFGQSETIYIHQYLSLTALARCQASRAAVEGKL